MKTTVRPFPTLAVARATLAPHRIEIRRWHSRRLFADANYLVRVQKARMPRKMDDGSVWDGWEHIGYFDTAEKAIRAAYEAAEIEL